jgi:L-threonylcarbamoyladenylate synthase
MGKLVNTVEDAIAALGAGHVVGLPTETVYGLAADASNELAVRRIFATKRRPNNHPLIVHVADIAAAKQWAGHWPNAAQTLAQALWPGPLTLIVPKAGQVLDVVTGGQATVGLRVPGHAIALDVLARFGGGLAAPSANRFGRVSPTTAAHVRDEFGAEVPVVLDGGPAAIGVESTIVDVSSETPQILRPGGISRSRIEALLGRAVPVGAQGSHVRAPGQLDSHYAPRAGVVVVPVETLTREVEHQRVSGLRVGVISPQPIEGATWLRVPADTEGYARELYAQLREADARGLDVVVCMAPPINGLGEAVADRLAKAAHPTRIREQT